MFLKPLDDTRIILPAALPGTAAAAVPVVEALQQALAIGDVLEAIAARDGQTGAPGLTVNSRFVPAQLPGDVRLGEQLKLEVTDNTSQLLMRILERRSAEGESPGAALKSFLPQQSVERLRTAAAAPSSLTQALPLNAGIGAQEGQPAAPAEPAAKMLEILLKAAATLPVVDERRAEHAETVRQALNTLATKAISSAVTVVQTAALKQQQEQSGASQQEHQLLKAIDQIFQQLQAQPEVHMPALIEHGPARRALPLPTRPETPGLQFRSEKPAPGLPELLLGMTAQLESGALASNEEMKGIIAAVAAEVRRTLDDAKAEPKLKEIAKKGAEVLQRLEISLERSSAGQQSVEALKMLETLLQAQEVLSQVNPVMQSLGEPALILMPALLNGLLLRWDMTVEPDPRRVEEDHQRPKGQTSGTFQRVQLFLPFPGIGAVEVDLAHNQEELLLNLTLENDEATSFIRQKLPLLQESLNSLGVKRSLITARTGEPSSIAPDWYRELVRRSIVA